MSKKEKNSAHHAPNIEKQEAVSAENSESQVASTKSAKGSAQAQPDSEGLSQTLAALEKRVAELEGILKDNPVVSGLMKVQERIQELETKASEISEKSEKAWGELRQTLSKAWDDLQAKRTKGTSTSEAKEESATH